MQTIWLELIKNVKMFSIFLFFFLFGFQPISASNSVCQTHKMLCIFGLYVRTNKRRKKKLVTKAINLFLKLDDVCRTQNFVSCFCCFFRLIWNAEKKMIVGEKRNWERNEYFSLTAKVHTNHLTRTRSSCCLVKLYVIFFFSHCVGTQCF